MDVICRDRLLTVSFKKPQMALSWAIVGGGRRRAKSVAWCHVKTEELTPPVNAKQFLQDRLTQNRLFDVVGMLTSADLDTLIDVRKEQGILSARCIATVDMSNALRIGDPAKEIVRVGTINLLCAVSVPLSEEAHLEALSVAAEARTAAVLEARIESIETALPATGTGTDCIVVTAPGRETAEEGEIIKYAGKHTVLGHLIGSSVLEAVKRGLEGWKRNPKKEMLA